MTAFASTIPDIAATSQPMQKTCEHCGKPFSKRCPSETRISRFCSQSCSAKKRYDSDPAYRKWIWAERTRPRKIARLKPKQCEVCRDTYAPTNPCQRWCTSCVPDTKKAKNIMRVHSLSWHQYQRLLDRDGAACAICGGTDRLSVDHEHASGSVRGILCTVCNTKLGMLEDGEWLGKACKYLTRRPSEYVSKRLPPATIYRRTPKAHTGGGGGLDGCGKSHQNAA